MIPLCESTVIAGKYRLERVLASGGMGAVWVARHLQLDEPVAIKFMSAQLPAVAEARLRFAREARAAARLRSPHVVQVLDHGVDGDVPYIVMELLEGEHLGDRLRREGRLSLRAASLLTAQIAKALGRAHRAGIIHRDLKPANIFLAKLDDEEIVKVLDFGIAKSLSGPSIEATHSNILIGSPLYMSPEQARSRRTIDHRSDLWSLGAILFRALTGTPLFEGSSPVDVIVQICTGALPVATHIVPTLPPEIDAFFARALDRDPDGRFDSAREMSEELWAIAAKADPSTDSGSGFRMRAPEPSQPSEVNPLAPDRAAPTSRMESPAGRTSILGSPLPNPVLIGRAKIAPEVDEFIERAFATLVGGTFDPSPRPPVSDRSLRLSGTPESTVPNGRAARLRPFSAGERGSLAFKAPRDLQISVDGPRSLSRAPNGVVAPRSAAACLIDEGFDALRRGERDLALIAWQQALDLEPRNRMLAINLRRLSQMLSVTAPLPK